MSVHNAARRIVQCGLGRGLICK